MLDLKHCEVCNSMMSIGMSGQWMCPWNCVVPEKTKAFDFDTYNGIRKPRRVAYRFPASRELTKEEYDKYNGIRPTHDDVVLATESVDFDVYNGVKQKSGSKPVAKLGPIKWPKGLPSDYINSELYKALIHSNWIRIDSIQSFPPSLHRYWPWKPSYPPCPGVDQNGKGLPYPTKAKNDK